MYIKLIQSSNHPKSRIMVAAVYIAMISLQFNYGAKNQN